MLSETVTTQELPKECPDFLVNVNHDGREEGTDEGGRFSSIPSLGASFTHIFLVSLF